MEDNINEILLQEENYYKGCQKIHDFFEEHKDQYPITSSEIDLNNLCYPSVAQLIRLILNDKITFKNVICGFEYQKSSEIAHNNIRSGRPFHCECCGSLLVTLQIDRGSVDINNRN